MEVKEKYERLFHRLADGGQGYLDASSEHR
jgi:hypothetical protein